MENKKIFIDELCRISNVSDIYANAAWFTLSDDEKKNPTEAATNYNNRLQTFRTAFNN